MSGKVAQEFGLDPLAILGFGFIGLAFLMAILGYRALKEVIAAPAPKENVVKLARLFMYLSLALLVAAGPLQLALLWAQSAFAPKPVNLKISLINSGWNEDQFGKVMIIRDGESEQLEKMKTVSRAVANGAIIQLQLEEVIDKIEEMQTQLLVVTKESERLKLQSDTLPAVPDPGMLSQGAG